MQVSSAGCRQFTAEQGQLPAPRREKHPKRQEGKGTGMSLPRLHHGTGAGLDDHSSRVTARTWSSAVSQGMCRRLCHEQHSPVNRKGKTPRNHSLTIRQHDKNSPELFSLLGVPQQGLVLTAERAGGAANPQHRLEPMGLWLHFPYEATSDSFRHEKFCF